MTQGDERDLRHSINDPEVLREVIAHYYGAVDARRTRIWAVCSRRSTRLGMGNRTLVVFTADHGNMLGERNRMFKGVMYESSARAPAPAARPGKLAAGLVADAVVDNSAVMPTLLELAGLPVSAGIQGRSLVREAAARSPAGQGVPSRCCATGWSATGPGSSSIPTKTGLRGPSSTTWSSFRNMRWRTSRDTNMQRQDELEVARSAIASRGTDLSHAHIFGNSMFWPVFKDLSFEWTPSVLYNPQRVPHGTSYLICGLDPPFFTFEHVCADELQAFSGMQLAVHLPGPANVVCAAQMTTPAHQAPTGPR